MVFDASCDENFNIVVKAKVKGKIQIPWTEFEQVVRRLTIRGRKYTCI